MVSDQPADLVDLSSVSQKRPARAGDAGDWVYIRYDTFKKKRLLSAHLSALPKFRLGDLTAHDQFAVKCCELGRLYENFFADTEIVDRVVDGCLPGT